MPGYLKGNYLFLGGTVNFCFTEPWLMGGRSQGITGWIFFLSDAISSKKFLSGGIPWGYSFLVKKTGGGGKEKSDNPTIESQNDISIGLVEFEVPKMWDVGGQLWWRLCFVSHTDPTGRTSLQEGWLWKCCVAMIWRILVKSNPWVVSTLKI